MKNQKPHQVELLPPALAEAYCRESSAMGAIEDETLDVECWIRFIRDRAWSRTQKHRLLAHFGSIDAIYSANQSALKKIAKCIGKRPHSTFYKENISADMHWLEHPDHCLLTFFDRRYPALLREIVDPPIALYASGNLKLLDNPKVAIVGSRRPSPAGERVVAAIAGALSELGITVVSGLALGIDGCAHQAALDASGSSIAVVGSGIDVVYPARNANLYKKMNSQGLILSEYPLGMKPSRYTFPDRNRVVSGLCSGVIIVEAAERSGTLITARLAMEQNRELMVVPGSALSDQYKGSHRLIREGAALVTCVDDVVAQLVTELSEYCEKVDAGPAVERLVTLSTEQQRLLHAVDYEPTFMDQIIETSGLTSAEVARLLLELELQGMVATTAEGGYIRCT